MSKKDYELIANAVRDSGIDPASKQRIAQTLASRLKADNPRFNSATFIEWCLA